PARVHGRHADGASLATRANGANAAIAPSRAADSCRARSTGALVPGERSLAAAAVGERALEPARRNRRVEPVDRRAGARLVDDESAGNRGADWVRAVVANGALRGRGGRRAAARE